MAHTSLESYYHNNFALMQHHKYSLTELDNLIPWEKEIYITLLSNHLEKQRLEHQQKHGI